MAKNKIQAPKGVSEYCPPRSRTFEWVRNALIKPAALAGYELIELPVFGRALKLIRSDSLMISAMR